MAQSELKGLETPRFQILHTTGILRASKGGGTYPLFTPALLPLVSFDGQKQLLLSHLVEITWNGVHSMCGPLILL